MGPDAGAGVYPRGPARVGPDKGKGRDDPENGRGHDGQHHADRAQRESEHSKDAPGPHAGIHRAQWGGWQGR